MLRVRVLNGMNAVRLHAAIGVTVMLTRRLAVVLALNLTHDPDDLDAPRPVPLFRSRCVEPDFSASWLISAEDNRENAPDRESTVHAAGRGVPASTSVVSECLGGLQNGLGVTIHADLSHTCAILPSGPIR